MEEKVAGMKKPVPGENLEDSEMKGVSSLMKMKDSWGEDGADGKGEGLGFVLRGIDMNSEQNGDNKSGAGSVGGPGSDVTGHLGVNGDVPAENGGEQRAEKIGKPSVEGKNEGGGSVGSGEYSVGDFVWGKVKSHPWWPGRVYDPSDASEYALKLRQEGKLLVAYFGDGTFAWCHPSQLKRFEEKFQEMMSQSSSKAFLNAVKEAVDEMGMLVNLKITCPCVRGTEQAGPFVANSGVKAGVLLPDKGVKKLGASWIEPTDLLTGLRHKAQVANVATGLELGVLKGWILGFYRTKVSSKYKLPEYVEPELIPGLEDKKENAGENSEMGVLSRGPVEEEKEAGKQGASENGTQRKQKSIAEILGANRHSKEKISPRRRKMANLLESSPVVPTGESVEQINESSEAKQKKKRGRKKKIAAIPGNESGLGGTEASEPHKEKRADKSEVKDSSDKGYMSRERKRSRYLSPPYTNLNKGDKKGYATAESLGDSGIVYLGERMTKAAENLFRPNEKSSLESPTEVLPKQKTVESQPPKQSEGENTIVQMEIEASAGDVLSKVHSLARDPQRRLSTDAVEGFLRNFRSSVYIDDPKSDVKIKEQTARKRKSQEDVQSELSAPKVRSRGRPKKNSGSEKETAKLHSVPSYGEGQAASELQSPETKPKRKRTKKVKESQSDVPTVKKADESELSDQENGDKGASLVVSFGPGSSLPSKEELLRIFGKFGSLNESKTDMFYNNFCGKIAFKKTSDAESALEISQKTSPFEPASVTYELKQASPKKPKPGSSSQPKKQKKPSSAAAPKSEPSEAEAIKERLQVVTSMLDRSNGKLSKKMRARVKGELKGVLEKISAAGGSSTSA